MLKNQFFIEKATSFFYSIQQRNGYGGTYESKVIPEIDRRCTFSNIRINDYEFCVGFVHQTALTTVVVCDTPDAFRNTQEGSIVYVVYGGKLAPKSERHSYPSTLKINNRAKDSEIRSVLTLNELIRFFGPGNASLSGLATKATMIELVYGEDQLLKQIKPL